MLYNFGFVIELLIQRVYLYIFFRINKAISELKKYTKAYNDREKKKLEGA